MSAGLAVLKRTVVGSGWLFNNLCRSHRLTMTPTRVAKISVIVNNQVLFKTALTRMTAGFKPFTVFHDTNIYNVRIMIIIKSLSYLPTNIYSTNSFFSYIV